MQKAIESGDKEYGINIDEVRNQFRGAGFSEGLLYAALKDRPEIESVDFDGEYIRCTVRDEYVRQTDPRRALTQEEADIMLAKHMLGGITELLNEVIADPERIQIPKSDHEESQEIKRLNTEISKALNTVSFDKEAIKQKMLTCVSEKYTSLGTEEITAQSLKDIFKTVPPLTAYDSDLTDQAVSEIQLKRNGTISCAGFRRPPAPWAAPSARQWNTPPADRTTAMCWAACSTRCCCTSR